MLTRTSQVFFQGTNRKLKGDCGPQDIGHACRSGPNSAELYSSDPDVYAIVLQVRAALVGVPISYTYIDTCYILSTYTYDTYVFMFSTSSSF